MKNGKYKKNKPAFTLAEVLVTLLVIGIIAAIVVPAVNSNSPKQNKVMFKKAYLTLQKAVDSLINDDYLYPSEEKFEITTGVFIPMGFRYTSDPSEESLITGSSYYNKFCYHLAKKLDLVGAHSCPTSVNGSVLGVLFGSTVDGIDWYISPGTTSPANQFGIRQNENHYRTKIIVDVNGNRPPNCSADSNSSVFMPASHSTNSGNITKCPNPDTFIIGVRYDGRLKVGSSWWQSDETVISGGSTYITDQAAIDILKSPLENR